MKLVQRPALKQQQILAPQLIQSLKMLQVPILKLEQMIRHELAINPMLEEKAQLEETDLEHEESLQDDEPQKDEPVDSESSKLDEIDWESYFEDEMDYTQNYRSGSFEKADEDNMGRTAVFEKNIYQHLLEQLNFTRLENTEHLIGEFIIGNIDESGFLTMDVSEIAEALSVSERQVWEVLSAIQGFDPAGVGARNLREALLIQLNNNEMIGTLPYLIVVHYFDRLDKLSHSQLARYLKVPQERIEKAFEDIRQLVPKPALGRFSKPAAPVIPDLIVDRIDDDFIIYNNDRNIPRLQVSTAYREMLKKDKKDAGETKKYIKEKLDQARWLINSINQRRSTMLKVMNAIVENQKEFFMHGESHLKPLRMEEIADEVSMNVATISRVANDKYVQTPMGVFEIKYFFNSGVSKDDGEELTKRTVKSKIEEIINEEDPSKPLPDQKIKELLEKDGINIARRTVSKYREELKIMPARFRKRTSAKKGGNNKEEELARND
ncbi:MAG: RNA polymerase factor sigma-54 [candidate division Zixibacteria bacterium]|nr:RNA polymerase factor sigma-54 [candidate division Zixibacteria bacterium]